VLADFDFTQADKDFSARSETKEGQAAVEKAKVVYEKVLKDPKSTNQDKLHAVEHLGKIAYYVGELLTSEDDSSKRVEIFSDCVQNVEAIAHIEIPSKKDAAQKTKTPEYLYWRSVCLALEAKSSNVFKRMGLASSIKSSLKNGLEVGDAYEGGGIFRAAAGVYIKPAGRIFGLYQPEEALTLIDKALNLGADHYNVYLIKADVLDALSKKEEAQKVLQEGFDKLKTLGESKYPKDLEPETKIFKKKIEARLPKASVVSSVS